MPLLKNILKKIGKYGLYTILFLCSLVIIGIVSGISFYLCADYKIFGWKL